MKKLINKAENIIVEQLKGMQSAHPELEVHISPHYILRKNRLKKKVAVISGGGSGHEPMHGGFVKKNMLDGACPGEIFTSPTPDQMYECGKAANNGMGVLFIVKNYTGDVLSFETAAELLHQEGIDVQNILVDDDVAVKDSLYTAGRRGVGLTVLMEKIVGSAAEEEYDLERLANLARKVNTRGRSIGMALTSCTVPAHGKPTFDLSEEEIEIGIGIHGEPGIKREKLKELDKIVDEMLENILSDKDYKRKVREFDKEKSEFVDKEIVSKQIHKDDEVIVMVNSMGGTPISELYGAYRRIDEVLREKGIRIVRNLIGPYITSLEMQGFSITILRVDEEILKHWDKKC